MLSWPLREIVGRAIVVEELVIGPVEANETTGANWPGLVRGRSIALEPVIVSWEGRDLRVWISMPDIERIDSCEVDRRRVGWKSKGENGSSILLGSSKSIDGRLCSASSRGVNSSVAPRWRSGRSSTSSSSSSWMTLLGRKAVGTVRLRVECSDPRLR